jgi:hypothetical protein
VEVLDVVPYNKEDDKVERKLGWAGVVLRDKGVGQQTKLGCVSFF